MSDPNRSWEQLVEQLQAVQERVAALEQVETELRRTQAALQESEARFQLFMDNSPVVAFMKDEQTRHIYINKPFRDIFQTGPEDLLGKTDTELYPAEIARKLGEHDAQVRAAGQPSEWIETVPTPDGVLRHWLAFKFPFQDASGRQLLGGVAVDITQRKQAEEALRLSEERLRLALQAAQSGTWDLDLVTGKLTWSDGYESLFGLSPGAFHGTLQEFTDRLHPDDRDAYANEARRACDTRTPFNLEFRALWPDGSVHWIAAQGRCQYDESGQPVRMLGVGMDITRRKQAEEAMRRQALIFENLTDAVIVTGPGHQITDWNPAAERTFGYTRAEAVGQTPQFLRINAPPTRDAEIDEVLARDGRWAGEFPFRRKDGSEGVCETVILPLCNAEGRRIGWVGINRDVTRRKAAKAKLREYADQLQALSRRLVAVQEEERHRLARELHDEIGQVLTAVSINLHAVQGLAGAAAQPRLEESVAIVDRAIQQVRNLSLDLRPSVLDDLGLEAALRWYLDRQARRTGLLAHFQSDLSAQRLPPELETTCFRVAQEALTNVARHARARQVWLLLEHDRDSLRLVIRDDGIGFDVEEGRRSGAQGKTFGILGMQERVMLAGGELEIVSSPGQGTEVRTQVPLPRDGERPSSERSNRA